MSESDCSDDCDDQCSASGNNEYEMLRLHKNSTSIDQDHSLPAKNTNVDSPSCHESTPHLPSNDGSVPLCVQQS